jgi:DNA-binding PadR family transcriptional regulator
MTAKEIAEKYPSIPQATLYRNLKSMVDGGAIRVAKERKVRNLIEKIYEIVPGSQEEMKTFIEENPKENLALLFQDTLTEVFNEFYTYFQQEEIDPLNDGLGISITPFYATIDELKECALKIGEVMKPYFEAEDTPERELRSYVRIFTPPKK